MSESRVYQGKMLNSDKNIIICNWKRGEGKTYSVFQKILKNGQGDYLYVSPHNPIAFKELVDDYIKTNNKIAKELCKKTQDKYYIVFKNGEIINIRCFKPNNHIVGFRNINAIFFDECIPNKEFIENPLFNYEQIFVMITNDNIEYIDSRKSTIIENFYDNQIKELMMEYSIIRKDKTTTLTRENILKQIKILQDMKKSNI